MQIQLQIYKFVPEKQTLKQSFRQKHYVIITNYHNRRHHCGGILCFGNVVDLPSQGSPHSVGDIDKPQHAEDGHQVRRAGDTRGYGTN